MDHLAACDGARWALETPGRCWEELSVGRWPRCGRWALVGVARAADNESDGVLSGFATMVATTEVSKIVYKILYCHTLLSL